MGWWNKLAKDKDLRDFIDREQQERYHEWILRKLKESEKDSDNMQIYKLRGLHIIRYIVL